MCGALGAAVGALLDLPPADPWRAEARIAVNPERGGLPREQRSARIARIAASPSTADSVALRIGSVAPGDDPTEGVAIRRDPSSSMVSISARAQTGPAAVNLSNTYAATTLAAAEQTTPTINAAGVTVLGSFEQGLGAFALAQSRFSVEPARLEVVRRGARYGAAALEATCRPVRGCGPAAVTSAPLRAGTTYTATAWVRTNRPVRAKLVIGANADDVATGPPTGLSGQWRRLAVQWTPSRMPRDVEVALQTQTPTAVRYTVDGVLVLDPGNAEALPAPPLARAREASVLGRRRTGERLFPATVATRVESSSRTTALVGGLAGLLIGAAGVLAGKAASARREQG